MSSRTGGLKAANVCMSAEYKIHSTPATNLLSSQACQFHVTLIGAWDFDEINRRYGDYLKVASRESQLRRKAGQVPDALAHWLRDERAAWLYAVNLDPLLPEALLPPGYLGQKAAAVRQAALASVQGVWKTTTHLLL